MVLVIDNYDSFTYNLVQYLGEMQVDMRVYRNDQLTLEQVVALAPDRILVSPGPCSPRESGLSNDIIRSWAACSDIWRLPGASMHWPHVWG
jgi:anthranilate/para-aminobenzoate synthase component II